MAGTGAPLAALAALLDGAHLATPDEFPAVVAAAGQAMGLLLTVYVTDYEQRLLLPLLAPGQPPREPLLIDSTLAGHAFQRVRTLSADSPPGRLWVPILDGVERLGVLEVATPGGVDADAGELRDQLRWLASLIGHLIVVKGAYGDGLDRVRRQRPRTVAAELVWQLLPPLTFGSDRLVISAFLEPCYDLGGDAFDYGIAGGTAHIAIIDAIGHSLAAGLISTAAVAALRNARRNGASLADSSRLVDATLAEQFGEEKFATGVLADLDIDSGLLRYLVAGHPEPLVLRAGKVVKALGGGRRLPFGLGSGAVELAQEQLEPGDWLIFYTDGVVEARNSAGSFFGLERFVDFLEREAASEHPPPETLRRLVQAVLAHQHGQLQDDATVLVVQWASGAERSLRPE